MSFLTGLLATILIPYGLVLLTSGFTIMAINKVKLLKAIVVTISLLATFLVMMAYFFLISNFYSELGIRGFVEPGANSYLPAALFSGLSIFLVLLSFRKRKIQ